MELVAHPTLSDFEKAAQDVLSFLGKRLGFDLWMVTRTAGEDFIILKTHGGEHEYEIREGTVFNWADTFCSQMVAGRGPRVAPRSQLIPAYAQAPTSQDMPIAAYIGVPLLRGDGGLFGTLCAIHPTPQPESIAEEQELVELLGNLLSTVLRRDLKLTEEIRRAERAQVEALTDGLTGLYNRRGWDRLLAAEEERCRRFGHPAFVICIDLDGLKKVNDTQGHAAGDELIRRAAAVLRDAARSEDVVARLGGDELAVLGVESDQNGAEALTRRLRDALKAEGIGASLGLALRTPGLGLQYAWEAADQAMYQEKRESRRNV